MKAALATSWLCLTCLKTGTYDEPDTKTDTGDAAKHLRTCPGATVSATQTGVLEILRARLAG